MKLTVFGSTGKVGRNVVSQALEAGYDVTAFARSAARLGLSHDRLRVVEGDVLDPAAVARAITGSDAVICALGMPLFNKEKLRTRGTKVIVAEMEKQAITRLICLSGLGIGDSRAVLPWHYKAFVLPVILRHVYADHASQEAEVRASSLDWTLARPANFVEGGHTGHYRHGFGPADPSPSLKISFADVADFLLKQVRSDRYLHQAPGLSY
ncbi:NAD(P)-dependent oxidoreductase [Rhodovibrionaceae bacterium A322]